MHSLFVVDVLVFVNHPVGRAKNMDPEKIKKHLSNIFPETSFSSLHVYHVITGSHGPHQIGADIDMQAAEPMNRLVHWEVFAMSMSKHYDTSLSVSCNDCSGNFFVWAVFV